MRSDFDLLAAWRGGEQAAGNELFDRHFPSVFAFFRSKLEDVAEDLTQQTFLNCAASRDEFRAAASFRTYLFAVARNVFYAHLRSRARGPAEMDFEVTSVAELGASVSTMLILREQQRLLVHALRRLPIDLQVALELYYVQRLRGQELVEALELPNGTVRSRIRRGLEQLRANMAELASAPQPIRTTLTDLDAWAATLHGASTPVGKPPG